MSDSEPIVREQVFVQAEIRRTKSLWDKGFGDPQARRTDHPCIGAIHERALAPRGTAVLLSGITEYAIGDSHVHK